MIIHRQDNTFVITFDGNPYHIIKGMDEYSQLIKDYAKNPTEFTEEFVKEVVEPIKTYKDLRCEEYPSIAEQLDMQYWDKVNGTTIWFDTIKSIKNKYPKTR